MWKSHRFSYFLATGELPAAPLVVRHKCKSKNCVNPDHLEPGTKSENELDKVRDGTDDRGEKSVNAKLTEAQVLDIRSRSGQTLKELAMEFNVHLQTIWNIIHRKRWKHI
jgi:regulator of sirC expression with transglutaminase-like and TPR domain